MRFSLRRSVTDNITHSFCQALAAFKEAAEVNPKSQEITQKIRNLTRLARNSKREAANKTSSLEEAIKTEEQYEKAKADQVLSHAVRSASFLIEVVLATSLLRACHPCSLKCESVRC
jgi:2-methylisocitrate lyase-like PEP mutase family enzyme